MLLFRRLKFSGSKLLFKKLEQFWQRCTWAATHSNFLPPQWISWTKPQGNVISFSPQPRLMSHHQCFWVVFFFYRKHSNKFSLGNAWPISKPPLPRKAPLFWQDRGVAAMTCQPKWSTRLKGNIDSWCCAEKADRRKQQTVGQYVRGLGVLAGIRRRF